MNAYATIWRADSPLARCRNCGAQSQFHGRPNFSCTDFAAEEAEDIDPTDLNHRDLVRHCDALAGRYSRATGVSDAEMTEADQIHERIEACRDEIDARLKAIFGVEFDDLRQTMGF